MTEALAEVGRVPGTRLGALMLASLVTCGLFVAEDATVLAVRSSARAGVPGTTVAAVIIDLALAAVMVAYNYAASRYVVSATASMTVRHGMARRDAERRRRVDVIANRWLRGTRRALQHAKPLEIVKVAGDRIGRAAGHVGSRAARRGLDRTTRVLGDLARVNILGVPGAGLENTARGVPVTKRDSFRHCWLFVASWFAGARCVEVVLDVGCRVPLVGDVAAGVSRIVGAVFTTITDVTRPIGALTVAIVTIAVLHHAVGVTRVCRQNDIPDRSVSNAS